MQIILFPPLESAKKGDNQFWQVLHIFLILNV